MPSLNPNHPDRARLDRANELRRQRERDRRVRAQVEEIRRSYYAGMKASANTAAKMDVPYQHPGNPEKVIKDKSGYRNELSCPIEVLQKIKHKHYNNYIQYCKSNMGSTFNAAIVWNGILIDPETCQFTRVDFPLFTEYYSVPGVSLGTRNVYNYVRNDGHGASFGYNIVRNPYKTRAQDEFFEEAKDIDVET